MATQDGVDLAKELDLMFIETSAKTNAGINELFENLLEIILGETVDTNKAEQNGNTETPNTGATGKTPLDLSKNSKYELNIDYFRLVERWSTRS